MISPQNADAIAQVENVEATYLKQIFQAILFSCVFDRYLDTFMLPFIFASFEAVVCFWLMIIIFGQNRSNSTLSRCNTAVN